MVVRCGHAAIVLSIYAHYYRVAGKVPELTTKLYMAMSAPITFPNQEGRTGKAERRYMKPLGWQMARTVIVSFTVNCSRSPWSP